MHAATSTVSGGVAFRFQHIDHKSPDELEAHLMKTADPVRRARQREQILNGMETPLFAEAINRFDRLFTDMEAALGQSPWLAGDSYSLADAALTPTLTQFDHLQFLGVLDRRPRLTDWYVSVVARPNYLSAITDWLSESDVPLMKEKGLAAWPHVARLFWLH
jgi:glutathione S-transferase